MNPTTKTALLPEGIVKVIQAENSPTTKMLMDMRAGRNDDWLRGQTFPIAVDENGNQFMNTDVYCIDGVVIWSIWVWQLYWSQVRKGEIGLSPRVLFRLPEAEPSQIRQTSVAQP